MMTKGLEGYSLLNESSMSRMMMRATRHQRETSEEVVGDTVTAISEVGSEVGTVEAVASEEEASEEIHVEVSEVVALGELTEVASEAATEEGSEVAIEEDSEVAIEVALEAAGEDLIISRTEREIISSIAKTNDIINI